VVGSTLVMAEEVGSAVLGHDSALHHVFSFLKGFVGK
jgi:hypothetical protein